MNTDRIAASPLNPIDRQWVLEQIGGDENLLREIAQVFLLDGPSIRQSLALALAEEDFSALHAAAHCAKSAVGNFGAVQAMDAARALESAAKNGGCDELSSLTQVLCNELIRVEEALLAEVA